MVQTEQRVQTIERPPVIGGPNPPGFGVAENVTVFEAPWVGPVTLIPRLEKYVATPTRRPETRLDAVSTSLPDLNIEFPFGEPELKFTYHAGDLKPLVEIVLPANSETDEARRAFVVEFDGNLGSNLTGNPILSPQGREKAKELADFVMAATGHDLRLARGLISILQEQKRELKKDNIAGFEFTGKQARLDNGRLTYAYKQTDEYKTGVLLDRMLASLQLRILNEGRKTNKQPVSVSSFHPADEAEIEAVRSVLIQEGQSVSANESTTAPVRSVSPAPVTLTARLEKYTSSPTAVAAVERRTAQKREVRAVSALRVETRPFQPVYATAMPQAMPYQPAVRIERPTRPVHVTQPRPRARNTPINLAETAKSMFRGLKLKTDRFLNPTFDPGRTAMFAGLGAAFLSIAFGVEHPLMSYLGFNLTAVALLGLDVLSDERKKTGSLRGALSSMKQVFPRRLAHYAASALPTTGLAMAARL